MRFIALERFVGLGVLLIASFVLGCTSESTGGNETACERAASHVSQCTGEPVAPPTECSAAEAAEAQQYLGLPCDDIADEGKTDWFVSNCGWVGRLLGRCHSDICDDYRDITDHDRLVASLTDIGNLELQNLFYCDLPNMSGHVPVDSYLDLMHTAPYGFDWSEYDAHGTLSLTVEHWDVRWAFGFDPRQVYDEIYNLLPTSMREIFVSIVAPLTFIRKEFPERQGDLLLGRSNFGYSDERASMNPTRNHIRMEQLTNANASNLPILSMSYLQHPYYLEESGTGFIDFFRFLTPDIIIAKGNYGFYDSSDPVLNARDLLSPSVLQFWMVRETVTRELQLDEETIYLSVPMLRALFSESPGAPSEGDGLVGTWEGDLIMNDVIIRAEALLQVDVQAPGSLTTGVRGSQDIFTFDGSSLERDAQTLTIPLDGEPPLELRRVQGAADALVGRRCFNAHDDATVEEHTRLLPESTRDHFLAQYREWDDTTFCLYYLLRRR